MDEHKICILQRIKNQIQYEESLVYISSLSIPQGFQLDYIAIEQSDNIATDYNQGMSESAAKYKIFLDSDVFILNKNILIEMLDIFISEPKAGLIGVLGTKVIPLNGSFSGINLDLGEMYQKTNGAIRKLEGEKISFEYEEVAAVYGPFLATQFDITWREDVGKSRFYSGISQSIEFTKAGHVILVPKQTTTWILNDSDSIEQIGQEDHRNFFEKYRHYFSSLKNGNETNFLAVDQDHVKFTGERLVINKVVRENFNNVMEEHVSRYQYACNYVEGKRVLDAACGTGYGSKLIKGAGAKEVFGIDISAESLKHAETAYQEENIFFDTGDVNSLQFEDSKFDVVVSFETIEHIKDGARWIEESSRVLKDDGIFIVSTPNRSVTNPGTFFGESPLNSFHEFEYTLQDFIGELLKEYDVIEILGQSFIPDHRWQATLVSRQLRGMNMEYHPEELSIPSGYGLSPLGEIKNASPTYVIAVCRKKRVS